MNIIRLNKNLKIILVIISIIVAFTIIAKGNENGNGTKIDFVTTQNIGMMSSSSPSGTQITVAISPTYSQLNTNGNGCIMITGPAAVTLMSERTTCSMYWELYE